MSITQERKAELIKEFGMFQLFITIEKLLECFF